MEEYLKLLETFGDIGSLATEGPHQAENDEDVRDAFHGVGIKYSRILHDDHGIDFYDDLVQEAYEDVLYRLQKSGLPVQQIIDADPTGSEEVWGEVYATLYPDHHPDEKHIREQAWTIIHLIVSTEAQRAIQMYTRRFAPFRPEDIAPDQFDQDIHNIVLSSDINVLHQALLAGYTDILGGLRNKIIDNRNPISPFSIIRFMEEIVSDMTS